MRVRRVDACPACASGSGTEVVRLTGSARQRFVELSERKYGGLMNAWLAELDVAISKCGACGHHWYREQPGEDELISLYEAGRPLLGAADIVPDYSHHMFAEMRRLRRLVGRQGEARTPTLLDYGSGFGRWARAAAAAGFEATPYEPSAARSKQAAFSILTLTDERQLSGRSFDVINVEQVIEHVADPDTLLRGLRKLCHRGTILRITVPNIERAVEGHGIWHEWPFNGQRMHTMAPFEHLHGFTARSLTMLAQRAGFRPIPLRSIWLADPVYCARGVAGTVVRRLQQTKLLLMPGQ